MRRLTLAAALLAALAFSVPAPGANPSLHRYQTGKHVRGLQWLLKGHKPSHYKIATYKARINGRYDLRTVRAVKAMKWRLGYAKKFTRGDRAGRLFFEILKGQRKRPLIWIARAATRIPPTPVPSTSCGDRIVRVASGELGVREYPNGSNSGSRVGVYQSVTGAYRAAWCASFSQWVIRQAGLGTIADRSAGVYYIFNWGHARGLVSAQPHPGDLVGYLRDSGHMGIVASVTRNGFYAIEGNHDNMVARVARPLGNRWTVFLRVCPLR